MVEIPSDDEGGTLPPPSRSARPRSPTPRITQNRNGLTYSTNRHSPILIDDDDDDDEDEDEDDAYEGAVEMLPGPPGLTPQQRYEKNFKEIIEVIPDVSHEYVRELFDPRMRNLLLAGVDTQENEGDIISSVITQILDKGKYPKEKDRQKQLQRKSPDSRQWDFAKKGPGNSFYDCEA